MHVRIAKSTRADSPTDANGSSIEVYPCGHGGRFAAIWAGWKGNDSGEVTEAPGRRWKRGQHGSRNALKPASEFALSPLRAPGRKARLGVNSLVRENIGRQREFRAAARPLGNAWTTARLQSHRIEPEVLSDERPASADLTPSCGPPPDASPLYSFGFPLILGCFVGHFVEHKGRSRR